MTRPFLAALVALAAVAASANAAVSAPVLERVVIVMRHGVRPPTKSAAQMAALADRPWPDDAAWGAAPGDLTPHGAAAIRKLGADLRRLYAADALFAAEGVLGGRAVIWADGADQRTRETARALGEGLSPAAPQPFASGSEGDKDPLFDALDTGTCPFDPAKAEAAVLAQAPLRTPEVDAGLKRLQQIMAPKGCDGGGGVCLGGEDRAAGEANGVKLSGPIGTGATLAENLLLEFESGLPADQVGWGRAGRADLDLVMAVHGRASDLTRRTPYIAERRAGPLGDFVLSALAGTEPSFGPPVSGDARLVVLVGHDTNLANLEGVFGLDWRLPGQPDVTAPGTALAFERWRDAATGEVTLKLRVFYQDPDQVRTLAATPLRQVAARPADCGQGVCSLARVATVVQARLRTACPALAEARRRGG